MWRNFSKWQICLHIYHMETFRQLTICTVEIFCTWQSVMWRNFSTWQIFSPQPAVVMVVTNIRYVLVSVKPEILHTSKLPRAEKNDRRNSGGILDICHGHHGRCPWRKNLPCGEISPHDILLLEEILYMTDWHVEKLLHVRNVNTICKLDKWCVQFMVFCHIKLLENPFFWRFTLFCRDFFAVIYALLCGEKLSQKLCLWRKKDKYHVCP